ncbi:MAG: Hsp20/alpha crystallin family protein [Leptolyngbya sp. Prado105]|jgi:HSP20 family molecular chaperone IbpA|nr:Hsp20/alpha crystallin family protein [Leptolyngbya sp. Prado105]
MTFTHSHSRFDVPQFSNPGQTSFDARLAEQQQEHVQSLLWTCDRSFSAPPEIEVRETQHEIFLTIKIPNLRSETLNIQLSQETILIQGEQEIDLLDMNLDWNDYPFTFHSLIPLPSPIQVHSAIADLNRHTLSFVLQKAWKMRYQFKIEPIDRNGD